VCFETSFESKQPKLEPKLVSALSKTTGLFRLFCFYTETEIFDVSIEPKQTEDPSKQFEREYIWVISENLGLFRFVTKQFCLFWLFRYRFETPKQTETNLYFLFLVSRNKPKNTQIRSCFGLFRFEPKFIFVCFEDTVTGLQMKLA
jgi:hypothetical protein